MTQFLAIDWDQHEARFVLASVRGKSVKVLAVDSVPLVDVAEGGGQPRPDLETSLSSALARHKVGRLKTLVGVERSRIELLHMTLPPATDRELPELVANQAMRESSTISDESVLDFVAMGDSPTGPRQVTAAALSREDLDRIRQQCQTAGLTPVRMLFRPLASASLFLKKKTSSEEACLLVNRVGHEADLTVVSRETAVFSRTVRLPEGTSELETNNRLVTEIKRTLAVAPSNPLIDEGIESIYVYGGPEDDQELLDEISRAVSVPVQTIDPFAALRVPKRHIPPSRGRFASLLGMLLDEAAGKHPIDFLHPCRVPRPISRWRIAAVVGGVTAIVMIGVALHLWSTVSGINRENRALMERLKELDETMKKAQEQRTRIEAIAEWKARDVVWLDELRDLSIRFPSARDAVVLRMSLRPLQPSGGAIDLQGLVRDPKVVANMETQVRDQSRRVRSKRIQERALEKDYTWVFESSMSVDRRGSDRYVSHLPLDRRPVEEPGALAAARASGDPKDKSP